jgi:hypothetical protein
MDWSGVRARVTALGEHPGRDGIFGASGHRFALAPTLSGTDLTDLETWLAITLPDAYRSFLTDVGAGGAGPCYGVFPVQRDGAGWSWHGSGADLTDIARLAEPFPTDRVPEAVLDALDADKPDEDDFATVEEFDHAFERWDERLEALLYRPAMTAGAICIADEGCGYRDWLVVSGPATGTVWEDPRTIDMDLRPAGVTFDEWYLRWLADCESKLGVSESGVSESGASESDASQLGASESDASQLGASESDASQLGASESDASQLGASESDASQLSG